MESDFYCALMHFSIKLKTNNKNPVGFLFYFVRCEKSNSRK